MHPRGPIRLPVLFGLLLTAGLLPAGPYRVPITFALVTNTAYGQSVFLVGSLPELGNWQPTNAVKLVPGSCTSSNCVWSLTLGLPENTGYEYKFIKRDDCATCLSNAANVVWEPGPNRTNFTSAGPVAPLGGKSVFYYSGWTNPSIIYSNWTTGWTSKVMTAAGPGRVAGENLWRADNINSLGQTNLLLVFSDNNGHFDNPDSVNGRNYETSLDALLVQDGQVYNYWPASKIGAPWVETFTLAPTNGLQTRTIRVYLPRGFTNNLTKQYPVLYMNDGQNLFLGQGNFGGWNADTNASYLIRFGRMRELIIVGIDNTSDRTCEYNPCNLTSCGTSNSLAPRYSDFVINQLKPFMDTLYPTTAGRTLTNADNTAIVGSSRGGLCSVWLAWSHPETFHKVGGLSPSFWGCATTLNNLLNAPKPPLRIYLDSGDVGDFPTTDPVCTPCYDGEIYTLSARDNLINNGFLLNLDLCHWISHGDQHNEFYWNRRLPVCYQFLFPTSDEPDTIFDTVAPPRISGFQFTNNTFSVKWQSFGARIYSVLSCSNLDSNPANWSTLYTAPVETRPWNYVASPPTNGFRFFRLKEWPAPY